MSEWNKVRGTQTARPSETDTESSQFYVYERKEIRRVDEEGDGGFKGWEYLERVTPKQEWILKAVSESKAATDAMLQGMADLYELQLEAMEV